MSDNKNALSQSEFGKINWVDVLNSLYYALIAASVSFADFLASGKLPSKTELVTMSVVFFGGVIKRVVTNSAGNVLKKE